MNQLFADLSTQLAAAVDRAAASIVQVHSHHRPAAGVVFGEDVIVAPARALGDDRATVRLPGGKTLEGEVLGHALSMGIAVVRVQGLGVAPLPIADEPKVGHLAVAVGRTWSGGVMATLTNVAVVGGPLRTGRTSQVDRVIRIAQAPHGALTGGALVDGDGHALGLITGSAIRGTTVVLPAALVWPAAQQLVTHGGARQGYIGISSAVAALPERQRSGRTQEYAVLVTGLVPDGPADAAGVLVGDVIIAFDGQVIEDSEALVTLLRGDRVGTSVPLTILRGAKTENVSVTVGERPRG